MAIDAIYVYVYVCLYGNNDRAYITGTHLSCANSLFEHFCNGRSNERMCSHEQLDQPLLVNLLYGKRFLLPCFDYLA